jgi:8-oxo-dGTP diphosphatase
MGVCRKRYVAGFMFYEDAVLLVRKESPDWQRGLLNGVGGKVEVGESGTEAMVREFREETGVATRQSDWHSFCRETGSDYCTDFFATRVKRLPAVPLLNDAGEAQAFFLLSNLESARVVGNLRWLIPMALDWRKVESAVLSMKNNIVEHASW